MLFKKVGNISTRWKFGKKNSNGLERDHLWENNEYMIISSLVNYIVSKSQHDKVWESWPF